MNKTKEGDLVTAIMMYAIRCLAEGDYIALRSMQFGEREVEALKNLNIYDLNRVESLKAHCLNVALNRKVFWPMMEHLLRQRQQEDAQQALLNANAPQEMLNELYGMSTREYAARRRGIALKEGVGRPSLPSTANQERLFTLWREKSKEKGDRELVATDYLELHEQSGVHMRAIWQLTRNWQDYL